MSEPKQYYHEAIVDLNDLLREFVQALTKAGVVSIMTGVIDIAALRELSNIAFRIGKLADGMTETAKNGGYRMADLLDEKGDF